MAERVIAFIDGFNLYHGLRESRLKRLYWVDLIGLARQFLRQGQQLVALEYFTTHINPDLKGGLDRQKSYIAALKDRGDNLMVHYGHFLAKSRICKNCGNSFLLHEEKKTDVNIACRMIDAAITDSFDIAFLVSADSDLVPPVNMVKTRWPAKRVVAIFPPRRSSADLERSCNAALRMNKSHLKRAQLPNAFKGVSEAEHKRPAEWT